MHTAIPASRTGSRTCVVLSHTGAGSVEGSRWVCHTDADSPWQPPPHTTGTQKKQEAESLARNQWWVSLNRQLLYFCYHFWLLLQPWTLEVYCSPPEFLAICHQIFTTQLRHGCMSSRWGESLLGGAAGVPRSLWEGHGCLPKRMVWHGGWQCNTHTRMRGHDLKKVDLPGTTRSAGNLHADSGEMKLTKHHKNALTDLCETNTTGKCTHPYMSVPICATPCKHFSRPYSHAMNLTQTFSHPLTIGLTCSEVKPFTRF